MNDANCNPDDSEQELVFHIRVQFRRNSSMQGSIKWLDGQKKSRFRSVLELGNLIDSARTTALSARENHDSKGPWRNEIHPA